MSDRNEYRLIVADPPWLPTLNAGIRASRDKGDPTRFYQTLPVEAIEGLAPSSAPQAHLYLWCLGQHADWGFRVARSWGFEPVQLLTWCKPGLGVGRFQCNTEQVVVARKGSRHGQPFGPSGGTWFQWPRGRHSEKPQASFELFQTMSPYLPRLEMFARSRRDGWDAWGNEVPDDLLTA